MFGRKYMVKKVKWKFTELVQRHITAGLKEIEVKEKVKNSVHTMQRPKKKKSQPSFRNRKFSFLLECKLYVCRLSFMANT